MSNANPTSKQLQFFDNKRLLIALISVLVIITFFYQLHPFFDNESEVFTDTFSIISAPAYLFVPAILVGYSIIITVKLFKQKSYQAKAFLLFAKGEIFVENNPTFTISMPKSLTVLLPKTKK